MKFSIRVNNASFVLTDEAGAVLASAGVDNYHLEGDITKLGAAIGQFIHQMDLDSVAHSVKCELLRAKAAAEEG